MKEQNSQIDFIYLDSAEFKYKFCAMSDSQKKETIKHVFFGQNPENKRHELRVYNDSDRIRIEDRYEWQYGNSNDNLFIECWYENRESLNIISKVHKKGLKGTIGVLCLLSELGSDYYFEMIEKEIAND